MLIDYQDHLWGYYKYNPELKDVIIRLIGQHLCQQVILNLTKGVHTWVIRGDYFSHVFFAYINALINTLIINKIFHIKANCVFY